MFVFLCKVGDQILIGEDIIIKVISIEKDCVKFGIEVLKNVKVL